MKYRILADISFENRSDAIAFLNYIETIKENCASGTDNNRPITRQTRFHECKHDDSPPTRCGNYTYINFDEEVIEHE